MRIIKLLLVISVLGGLYELWRHYEVRELMAPGPNGFVSVVMPENIKDDVVLILAPEDCPSDAAERANDLARQLTERGIPNSLRSSVMFTAAEDEVAVKRTNVLLGREIPIVLLNGIGRSDPSVDDVVAAYNRTKSY